MRGSRSSEQQDARLRPNRRDVFRFRGARLQAGSFPWASAAHYGRRAESAAAFSLQVESPPSRYAAINAGASSVKGCPDRLARLDEQAGAGGPSPGHEKRPSTTRFAEAAKLGQPQEPRAPDLEMVPCERWVSGGLAVASGSLLRLPRRRGGLARRRRERSAAQPGGAGPREDGTWRSRPGDEDEASTKRKSGHASRAWATQHCAYGRCHLSNVHAYQRRSAFLQTPEDM